MTTNQDETKIPVNDAEQPAAGESGAKPDSEAKTDRSGDQGDMSGLQAECESLKEKWMRAQAELENYRGRAQKELQEQRKFESLFMARDLLPAMDNLVRAVSAAENTGNVTELIDGIRMVVHQFEGVLASHAAKPIECEGQPFDPNLHEAVQQIPSADHEPMTVVQEIERGFMMHDRVIRPSKVIVSCAVPAAKDAEAGGDTTSDT